MSVPRTQSSPPVSIPQRSGRTQSWLVPILVISVLVAVAMASFLMLPTLIDEMPGAASRPTDQPGTGQRLSALALEPLTGEGRPATLETVAGKVVVVNFWGAWCPPCRVEFPHLVDLLAELSQHPDFRLFLVSCAPGRDEDPAQLKEETEAFLASSNYQVPTYWDPGFKTRLAYHRAATLRGFPTTFVLDRHGVIRGIWTGFHPEIRDEIRELVLQLIL